MQRLLLAIIILEIPIQVDTYLFHQEKDAAYGAVAGLNCSITTICLVVLYVSWLFERALEAGGPNRPVIRVSFPAVCYLAVVALSALVADDWSLALFDAFVLGQAFLLYLYISNRVRTREDICFLVTMIGAAVLIEAVIMIGVWCAGRDVSISVVRATVEGSRTAGTMGSPVTAASYLALLLAPVVSILFTPLGRREKLLAAAAVCLGIMALILTGSRGAWIAFFVSGLLFLGLSWRRGCAPRWMPVAVAVGTIVVLLTSHHLIVKRVYGDDRGSAVGRIPLIQMGLRIIENHPVTGVGAGNCHHAVLVEAGAAAYRTEWLYTVHNKYILVGAETGIVGLVFFVWFLSATIRQGWRGWAFRDPTLSPIALALVAAIVGQMIHMSVDVFNGRQQVEMLWCCAALAAAISYVKKEAPAVAIE